jgi:hypothetical protein
MKMIHAAIAGVSASALLLIAPLAGTAKSHGGGSGGHSIHSASHFRSGHLHSGGNRGAYGQWPLYGGVVAVPPYGYDNIINYAAPATIVYVPEPPQALSCHRSQDTVTVPSETGGTSKITVTRC